MLPSRNHLQFLRLFRNLAAAPIRFNWKSSSNQLDRRAASMIILDAKDRCNQTFDDLAQKLNVNKVWLTSAILGQHPIDEQTSKQLIQTLKIDPTKSGDQLVKILGQCPNNRGCVAMDHGSKQDPIIRRLNEIVDVYGETIKMLIQEEFGDGIMSAIDCSIDFEKHLNMENNEARVIIKINGKYLQYKH